MNNCLPVINQSFILEACLLNFQNVYFIYLDPLTAGCWQTYDLQYATAVKQLKPNAGGVLRAARHTRETATTTNRFAVQTSGIPKDVHFILKAFRLKEHSQKSGPRVSRAPRAAELTDAPRGCTVANKLCPRRAGDQ